VARVADLALIAAAPECRDAFEMARMRAFMMLQQVVSDLIDHPRSSSRRDDMLGVSVDDLRRSLFDAAFVGADTVAARPGDTAEVAEFSLATAARSWSA
jgi:hypothetical protein